MIELWSVEESLFIALSKFAVQIFQFLYGSAEEGLSLLGVQFLSFFLIFLRFKSGHEFASHTIVRLKHGLLI